MWRAAGAMKTLKASGEGGLLSNQGQLRYTLVGLYRFVKSKNFFADQPNSTDETPPSRESDRQVCHQSECDRTPPFGSPFV